MQLSILIGTNRPGLLACSRIAQACSWAGPDVEVIIRDNSGNAEKAALLPQFQRENCNIIIAEPCDPLTNISAIMGLAKGEFIFILADDDAYFDHAIAALPGVIAQAKDDPSVVGITGTYAIELAQQSGAVEYKNIDSDDLTTRIAGFLTYSGPNILQYAPVRRELVLRIFNFLKSQPFLFSFHDQINCLLYLMNGKFVSLKRFLYLYELGPWEKTETAQERDVAFYKAAGLDPAINKLHWLLCAFEGAVLIRNSDLFPNYPLAQRQPIADLWFSQVFQRFLGHQRLTFGSPFTEQADGFCEALKSASGSLSFESLLTGITGFMAQFSEQSAERYFDFWSAQIEKGKAAPDQRAIA